MSTAAQDRGLALALVASLDDRALDRLAEALAPRLGGAPTAGPPVYTVATLALELQISERVVREAIKRGELDAVKRGRTYLITRAAVEAWATPDTSRARTGRRAAAGRSHRPVMASALARLDEPR